MKTYQISYNDHKKYFWFLYDKNEYLKELDFILNGENLKKLENLYDGDWVKSVYYLHTLIGDEKKDRQNADKFLNILFNYCDPNKISAARYNLLLKKIISENLQKDQFIPMISEYCQMGYYPLPLYWDSKILDGYIFDDSDNFQNYDEIIVSIINENKIFVEKNIQLNFDKTINFILGQIIKELKNKRKSFNIQELKKVVERELKK